jgi:hypothetical protein
VSGTGDYLAMAALWLAALAATVAFFRRPAARRQRAGLAALLGGNLLLLATLSLGVLLVFETQLRFFYDASDGDNRTMISRRWFDRHWRLNNFALRDSVDYRLARAPGRRRISFVGDSFTAGHGVADVETRYANRLRRARPEWEVHALARPGLETPDEAALLRSLLGQGYELDVVVLAFYVENVGRFVPELREYFAHLEDPLPGPLQFLLDHSFALDTFAYRAQTRWMNLQGYWEGVYREAFAGGPWQEQQRALRRFAAMVERNGGRFAALTFPMLADVEGRREISGRIGAFWQAAGVPHLDLLGVFEGHPARSLVANPHDAHPGPFAHELAARAIERFLVEEVLAADPPAAP